MQQLGHQMLVVADDAAGGARHAPSRQSCAATSPANCTCKWLAVRHCTIELHYSGLSTCLVGYDDAASPHVLQAPR
jgi:hypothetical protein